MKNRKLVLVVLALSAALFAAAPACAAQFGLNAADLSLRSPEGPALHAAGAHPDFTAALHFNLTTNPQTGFEEPAGDPRDVGVVLPTGFVGNPTATPKCTQAQLSELKFFANCAPETQVGLATIVTYNGGSSFPATVPVYNLVPPRGVPGQFAFNILSVVVFINASVDGDGEYHLRADVTDASQGLSLGDTTVKLWGTPASPSHNFERVVKGGFSPEGTSVPSSAPPVPLLSNPTTCSGAPLRFEVSANSWQESATFSTRTVEAEEDGTPFTVTDCDQVPFEPSLRAQPTTTQASSPTGLDAVLRVPQPQLAEGLSESHLRNATVELPAGMAVNPSGAGGLGACSSAQVGLGTDAAPSCPDSSKVGTVRIDTPLLEEPLLGSVYVAQQKQNKFGSLLALYLVVDDPVTGVQVKIPGKIEANSNDGQLVARFEDAPQLPFETLALHIDGGPRAPLMTPPACGTYTTVGTFTPWSGTAPVRTSDSFGISSGPEGGACPNGSFAPRIEAGGADPTGGRYSPFELRISRADGTEYLRSLSVRLPRGLLARLAGIPYCTDAALAGISPAEGTGAAQLANPACPAASKVGSVAVAAGAGPSPFWAKTGSAYLAGPYKGAPLSLAVVVPALAGPFDLGTVVVRTALAVDPTTAQVTATSDPLPTILSGIPLDLRQVRVALDRPDFTLNPTSCERQRVDASFLSAGGRGATASEPFAAAGCAGLGFEPRLALSFSGATARGGDPALKAVLRPRAGDANLSRVQVLLPKSSFIDQAHIDNPCTRVQFDAGKCPASSVLGTARAFTPLLGEPLEGPVYFRSNGGERQLPDIVADLRGQIHVVLVGFIDSKKSKGAGSSRVRTTFATVPDAPVSRFVLALKGGKRGLIENSADLCEGRQVASVRAVGQNGKVASFGSRVRATGCGSGSKRGGKG